jgi:hypothetical protein
MSTSNILKLVTAGAWVSIAAVAYGEVRKAARIARENEQLDALSELIKSLTDTGAGVIVPALKMIQDQEMEACFAERVFRPDVIEGEVKIGALIDRQIEKGLAQLVHLKEYKRLYKKKLVTGPLSDVIVPTSKVDQDN